MAIQETEPKHSGCVTSQQVSCLQETIFPDPPPVQRVEILLECDFLVLRYVEHIEQHLSLLGANRASGFQLQPVYSKGSAARTNKATAWTAVQRTELLAIDANVIARMVNEDLLNFANVCEQAVNGFDLHDVLR